jgi:hypothetical protein
MTLCSRIHVGGRRERETAAPDFEAWPTAANGIQPVGLEV